MPNALSKCAVHCKSSTAHCPRAMWQCVAGFPLPAAPRQCGSALQQLRCPLPPSTVAVHSRSYTARCPLSSVAVHCRSSTTRCPKATWQCIVGVPPPAVPGQ